MKLNYHSDTDSLYIHLSDRPGVETIEIKDGILIDIDENGIPVGIDLDSTQKILIYQN